MTKPKHLNKKSSNKKSLMLSVAALAEALLLIVFVSYSWFSFNNTGSLTTQAFSINADSGLRLNFGDDYSGSLNINNHINVSDFKLYEASSMDGRNIYFPTVGTGTNTSTQNMIFREGNAADVNTRYLSTDFTIRADAGATQVYLDAGATYARLSNGTSATAVRMAFNFNDGTAPVVVTNGLLPGYTKYSNAVHSVANSGTPTLGDSSDTSTQQAAHSINDYIYGTTPICDLAANEVKNITLTVWLEGTDADFSDTYANNTFDINVKFTSTWDKMVLYKFIDDTGNTSGDANPWVTKDKAKALVYDVTNNLYYPMTQSATYSSDHTWYAYVPEAVTNFRFNRYNPLNQEECWNYWTPDMSTITDRQTSDDDAYRTYHATGGSTNAADTKGPCGGYWENDGYPQVKVYFTNNITWNTPIKMYYFDSVYKVNRFSTGWPGESMQFEYNNIYNQGVYSFTVPKDATIIIDYDGSNQTNNIILSDYASSITSSNKIGFYITNTSSSSPYAVSVWTPTD